MVYFNELLQYSAWIDNYYYANTNFIVYFINKMADVGHLVIY